MLWGSRVRVEEHGVMMRVVGVGIIEGRAPICWAPCSGRLQVLDHFVLRTPPRAETYPDFHSLHFAVYRWGNGGSYVWSSVECYRAKLLITVLSGDFVRHLEVLDGVSQGSLEQVWFRTSQ